MHNFDFSGKDLKQFSPRQFKYRFSRKNFLMLSSINWPNFIAWLSLLLEILGNIWKSSNNLNQCSFCFKAYWRRLSDTFLPIMEPGLILKQFLYYSFINCIIKSWQWCLKWDKLPWNKPEIIKIYFWISTKVRN